MNVNNAPTGRLLLRPIKDFLRARPAASAIASNAGWLIFDKMMRMALALTVGAWVARHLGPSQFGELSYAITLIALCQGIANLGADGIIVRDLSRNPEAAPVVLGTAIRLRLGAGIACWTAACGLAILLRPHDTNAAILIAIIGASLVLQSAETVDLWFQSQSRNAWTVKAKLVSYIIANALRIGMLLNDAPLWAFALAAAADAALLAIALTTVYRQFPTPSLWHYSWTQGRRLLHESAPFMVGGLAALLYMRIDQLMIREMLGERALGFYSAAVPLSQVWAVIPVTLATALAPYISRMKAAGEIAYMAALSRVFRLFAAISLVVTVITALLAERIIQLLYGTAFAPAGQVLALHVFSNLFIFMGVAQGLWLVNEGLGRVTLYRTGLGVIVSVLGNWLLIPRFGLMGSAAVTVMAQFVAAVASNAIFAPHILKLQLLSFLPSMNWLSRRR